ncbi:MAPEG family protein [Candidatus Rariloculus sp.]|uniref:MAPEG family protein n=1 Tax=Candidatus Rariloculus sp. TaxID=3101265 RepID=UPI003D150307
MELVYIVILLALIVYNALGFLVGRARKTHGVKAPAITGPEEFERTFRVHQNTLESLIMFVPAVWIFGMVIDPLWAAVIGLVYIVGRVLYAMGYIRAAEKRGPGMMVSFLANAVLLLGGLVGLIVDMM